MTVDTTALTPNQQQAVRRRRAIASRRRIRARGGLTYADHDEATRQHIRGDNPGTKR